MRQWLIQKALAIISMAFLSVTSAQAADNPGQDLTGIITKLKFASETEKEAAAQIILQDRQRTVAALEQVVQDTTFTNANYRGGWPDVAIELLGKLHAVEAVPLLVNDLSLGARPQTRIRPTEEIYLCVGALIEIGSPALEPLLAKVEEHDDDFYAGLASVVFEKILGLKLAAAYLNDRLEHENEPVRRERINRVLKKIPINQK